MSDEFKFEDIQPSEGESLPNIAYETADVTLKMSTPEFEAVFAFLQNGVHMIEDYGKEHPEAFNDDDFCRDYDMAQTIKKLQFTFEKGK